MGVESLKSPEPANHAVASEPTIVRQAVQHGFTSVNRPGRPGPEGCDEVGLRTHDQTIPASVSVYCQLTNARTSALHLTFAMLRMHLLSLEYHV